MIPRPCDGRRVGDQSDASACEPGAATRIDLGFEYVRDRRVVDRGVPADARGRAAPSIADPARPLDGFDRTFFGDADVNRTALRRACRHRARRASLQRHAAAVVEGASMATMTNSISNAFAAGPATIAGGTETVAIEAYRDRDAAQELARPERPDRRLRHAGRCAHAAGRRRLCRPAHAQRTHQRLLRFGAWQRPAAGGARSCRWPTRSRSRRSPSAPGRATARCAREANAVGLYVQDQVKIGDHVEIIAGLRHDWFKLDLDNLTSGDVIRAQGQFLVAAARAGGQADRRPVASTPAVSRSYLPQSGDQFSSASTRRWPRSRPRRSPTSKSALKWQATPQLDVTLAAYLLDRTNTRATRPAHPARPC